MPFTTPEARRMTDTLGPEQVGDRCFLFYRPMIQAWRKSIRWTTAHDLKKQYKKLHKELENNLYQSVEEREDDITALELAWDVFFALDVLPYEQIKRMENGEVL